MPTVLAHSKEYFAFDKTFKDRFDAINNGKWRHLWIKPILAIPIGIILKVINCLHWQNMYRGLCRDGVAVEGVTRYFGHRPAVMN